MHPHTSTSTSSRPPRPPSAATTECSRAGRVKKGGYATVYIYEEEDRVHKLLQRYREDPAPAPDSQETCTILNRRRAAETGGGCPDAEDEGSDQEGSSDQGMRGGRWVPDNNTIQDLAITKTCNMLAGMPFVTEHTYDDEHIHLHMPYYGRPLHAYIHHLEPGERLSRLLHVLTVVARTCLQLQENGLMHTDLKPTNVLVQDSRDATFPNVTLIDFNIVSCRTSHPRKWTSTVGTWAYAPPEIVHTLSPTDTSMVWSLGMMISLAVGKHPFTSLFGTTAEQVAEQETWQSMMKTVQSKYPDQFPVSARFQRALPEEVFALFLDSCQWSHYKRIHLKAFYERCYCLAYGTSHTPVVASLRLEHTCDPTHVPGEERKDLIFQAYGVLNATKKPHLFVRACTLFDRCFADDTKVCSHLPYEETMAGCIVLAGLLTGSVVFDKPLYLDALQDVFGTRPRELAELVWNIADRLQWVLWERTADTFSSTTLPMSVWRDALLRQNAPYRQSDLFKEMQGLTRYYRA